LETVAHLTEKNMQAAQVVWDYMHMHQALTRCDAVIAMGSHDLRTAAHAAQLVTDGWAALLVCSGGAGRLTKGVWQKTEARAFADVAIRSGVKEENILLEEKSTNTSENLRFSAVVLQQAGISFTSVLLVHKPYMERRVWATARKVWPKVKVIISSPPIPMREYGTTDISLEEMIAIMTGDFQRIMEYPKRGFSIEQEIPQSVIDAFKTLIGEGFTSHLL